MSEHHPNKAEPEKVKQLYDGGSMPSQIAVLLNVSLTEVLDTLDKIRKAELENELNNEQR